MEDRQASGGLQRAEQYAEAAAVRLRRRVRVGPRKARRRRDEAARQGARNGAASETGLSSRNLSQKLFTSRNYPRLESTRPLLENIKLGSKNLSLRKM